MHKRILVITDNPHTHETLSLLIKQDGHECVVVPFHSCTREFLETEIPHFIICDDHPDQYSIRHIIKGIPQLAAVPVLVYIEHASDVAFKPLFPEVIHEKIRKFAGIGAHNKNTLLLIEDEIDLCKTLSYRFIKWGFDVLMAHDGETGLTMARNEVPDLIILDLQLPKKTGEEVCKALRESEATERIPIIMLTAKDSPVDRIIGKVIGANAYVTKPFDIAHLHELVLKLLT